MYLLDTNIWLERLLDQEHSDEVSQFLNQISGDQLFITDFSLHSIGVILARLKRTEALERFLDDAFNYGAVRLVHLLPQDLSQVVERISQYHLDFDDAYQYVAAEKYDLILVSLDKDFDNTRRKRKTPREILAK
ncbi:MAG: VapC toxin family PIN domain ribonuclease [Anaerolineae bacterium CG03_land_8_20_14_0_80_58_20]|nr:MAG: VapC toxin family PIN domain ribonuclease [Anaerolineae bacterium CG1_02_58_13]PIV25890.1 MAG: VapC toxin family PIN domain ribonuclease [Anaerolineae bacterium CG03_land_8_20_14_0_80_58_20]